jgi:hypothetical protein
MLDYKKCMGWHGVSCLDCVRLVACNADEDGELVERPDTVGKRCPKYVEVRKK